jgi:hypothetical protein
MYPDVMGRRWLGKVHLERDPSTFAVIGRPTVACGMDASYVAHTRKAKFVTCGACKRTLQYRLWGRKQGAI